MTKTEFEMKFREKAGCRKDDAKRYVDAFLECLQESLVDGECVRFTGFGTFEVTKKASKVVRNIGTGELMTIPEQNFPKFKPWKQLKEAMNA